MPYGHRHSDSDTRTTQGKAQPTGRRGKGPWSTEVATQHPPYLHAYLPGEAGAQTRRFWSVYSSMKLLDHVVDRLLMMMVTGS